MRGVPFGLRPCRVRKPLRMSVVGNDPCVVPVRVKDTPFFTKKTVRNTHGLF